MRANPAGPPPKCGYHRVVTHEDLSRLTDGQKACLRMVYRHMSSKDIARTLGISPHTVDQRLRIAMRALGVGSRVEAARILVELEGGAYQSSLYQTPHLVPGSADRKAGLLARNGPNRPKDRRHTTQAQHPVAAGHAPGGRLRWPLRKRGDRHNALAAVDRLIWIVAIPVGTMVAIGMLATGLNVVATLVGTPLATFR